MLLGGLAITIKQTALFEAVFFGLVAVGALVKSPMPWPKTLRTAAAFALIGAMPTLFISAYYALVGHWSEYWHAMVISNIKKEYPFTEHLLIRITRFYIALNPLVFMSIYSAISNRNYSNPQTNTRFYFFWLAAAAFGFLSVPNLYIHYGLPLLVPLCITASPVLAMKRAGPAILAFMVLLSFSITNSLDFSSTKTTQRSMAMLTKAIGEHGGSRGLFTFDGPILLYSMTGNTAPSALAFPPHLPDLRDNHVSHLKTRVEVVKIINSRPGAVLMPTSYRPSYNNPETMALALYYAQKNCTFKRSYKVEQYYYYTDITLYGDCQ
jgi:hypothetical protein